jgi:cytochrome c
MHSSLGFTQLSPRLHRTCAMHAKLRIASIALSMMPQLAQGQEPSALEQRGAELLTSNCARCHSVARTGDSPNSAAPPFRTLSRKYPIDSLSEALAEGLSVGHPAMPEFVFDTDEITAILAYLKSIQER